MIKTYKYKYNKKESHGYERLRTINRFTIYSQSENKVRLRSLGPTIWFENTDINEIEEVK